MNNNTTTTTTLTNFFIVPNNDAEALKIQQMLIRENQNFVVTNQAWGASWDKLEENVVLKVEEFLKQNPDAEVYGIELAGDARFGANIIDHHAYNADNAIPQKSSLGQVANLLNVELTIEEMFYEANDTGYIPEMQKLGESLKMSQTEIGSLIEKVNIDEALMQGITFDIKLMAEKAVQSGYVYDNRLVVIDVDDFRAMREITNILYKIGSYKNMGYDTTVINTHDDASRIIVFSKKTICDALKVKYPEKSWTGGNDQYGYFGIQLGKGKEKDQIAEEIIYLLEEELLGYHRLVEKEDILHTENRGFNLNIHQVNNSAVFHKAITEAKKDNEHGAFVHAYEADEYEGTKMFIVNAGAAGIVVKNDGDVVSVFKNPDIAQKDDIERINKELLLTAIKHGGKKLDCFAGFLPALYAKFGFKPVARVQFNDEFAPEGWNFERDGRPDIVFMVHNGDTVEEILKKQKEKSFITYDINEIPFCTDYDEAVSLQNSQIK